MRKELIRGLRLVGYMKTARGGMKLSLLYLVVGGLFILSGRQISLGAFWVGVPAVGLLQQIQRLNAVPFVRTSPHRRGLLLRTAPRLYLLLMLVCYSLYLLLVAFRLEHGGAEPGELCIGAAAMLVFWLLMCISQTVAYYNRIASYGTVIVTIMMVVGVISLVDRLGAPLAGADGALALSGYAALPLIAGVYHLMLRATYRFPYMEQIEREVFRPMR